MPQYEALGLRYVVTNPGAPLIPAATYAPLDPATRNYPQTLLPGGLDLTGIFAASPPFRTVTGLSVLVGTFGVTASGPIFATLCAANICTTGTADAATAADNGPLTFFFKTPLSVPPNSGFAYRFSHPSGKPVAIWLVPDGFGHENPSITFISVATRPMPQRVLRANRQCRLQADDPGAPENAHLLPQRHHAPPAGNVLPRLVRARKRRAGPGLASRAIPERSGAGRRGLYPLFLRPAAYPPGLRLSPHGAVNLDRKRFFFEKKNQKTFAPWGIFQKPV
jgi:hypothetical protein